MGFVRLVFPSHYYIHHFETGKKDRLPLSDPTHMRYASFGPLHCLSYRKETNTRKLRTASYSSAVKNLHYYTVFGGVMEPAQVPRECCCFYCPGGRSSPNTLHLGLFADQTTSGKESNKPKDHSVYVKQLWCTTVMLQSEHPIGPKQRGSTSIPSLWM